MNFIEYLPWVPEVPETALENGLWHPVYRVSDEVFLFLNRILNAQTIFRVSTIFLKTKDTSRDFFCLIEKQSKSISVV